MKRTWLALVLPLSLAAGCALSSPEVGEHAEGLTISEDSSFGIDGCGNSLRGWLEEPEWPIDSIAAGDMVFTRGELVEHLETHPGEASELLGQYAAAQLNLAVGFELPENVEDEMIEAEDFFLNALDVEVPPPVSITDFEGLNDFNRSASDLCFGADPGVTAVPEGSRDVRDGLSRDNGAIRDVRPFLTAQ